MKTMNIKKFTSSIITLVLALVIISGIQYAAADKFAGPADTFPNCDKTKVPGCNTPINVGTTAQIKNGGLSVNAFLANQNSQFKQDVTVDQLAGTAIEQIVCASGTGKLIKCGKGMVNASGPLTVNISSYCGSAGSAATIPSKLDYYQIGDAVHVYGIVRFNISGNAQCLSAAVSGLPKPFPSSGSPVITERSAALTYYGPSSNPSWKSISGVMDFNTSGSSNILSFSRYDNQVLTDPKTLPPDGEWMAFVDFTY